MAKKLSSSSGGKKWAYVNRSGAVFETRRSVRPVRGKKGGLVSHEDGLHEELKEPGVAAAYLDAAAKEGPETFFLALSRVVKAHGVKKQADAVKINRVSLYKMLSEDANPGFKIIYEILRSLGLRFSVDQTPPQKIKRA